MAKVLIIDDDLDLCKVLSTEIGFLGHDASTALTLQQGYELAMSDPFDVIFLDVRLPDGNGLDILPAIRRFTAPPEVIIMTGSGDADGAELAIKNGAWDYLQKPSSLKQMMLPLMRALQYRETSRASQKATVLNREGIVGSSPQLRSCLDVLAQSAASDANVLITGDTGTGKEVFAAAIHKNSKRGKEEFVVVDCASMTETLMESTLFGHERGAFTGADKQRAGLIMTAHGGTLFLDEIGELPLTQQRALLRVLEERRFRPVGGDREMVSDFRLIAATNRNLEDMVATGAFRDDLLHRLRSIVLHLPLLKEREGDIRELTAYFVSRLCDRNKIKIKGISPDFLDALSAYPWPGNVRELHHTLEQVLAHARDTQILYPEHLPANIRIAAARLFYPQGAAGSNPEAAVKGEGFPTFKDYKRQSEEQYLTELLHKSRGDVGEACKLSGMSRSNLYLLLKSHHKSLSG